MRVNLVTELLDLEDAIAPLLPAGVKILELSLEKDQFSAQLKVPVAGVCTLSARAKSTLGGMTLSAFQFSGASFMSGAVLSKIQTAISSVDLTRPPFHVWGESDGERLHISWLES